MRAEERQETQPVPQVWQERGGWCQGARGRGQERGQSQASARQEEAGWCLFQDTERAEKDQGGDCTFYRPWGPWG